MNYIAKFRYEKIEVVRVSNFQDRCNDMIVRIDQYIADRKGQKPQWKTATQIANEIGCAEITQSETRAVAYSLRRLGTKNKGSNGLKFLV